jgi:hypothetical protein
MALDDAELSYMAEMLGQYAESAVLARGFSISPDALERLRGFVAGGVMQTGLSGNLQDLDIARGQERVDQLVAELIGQALSDQQRIRDEARIKGTDYLGVTVDTIDDNTLSKATGRLCPGFWPFC